LIAHEQETSEALSVLNFVGLKIQIGDEAPAFMMSGQQLPDRREPKSIRRNCRISWLCIVEIGRTVEQGELSVRANSLRKEGLPTRTIQRLGRLKRQKGLDAISTAVPRSFASDDRQA